MADPSNNQSGNQLRQISLKSETPAAAKQDVLETGTVWAGATGQASMSSANANFPGCLILIRILSHILPNGTLGMDNV